MFCENPRKIFLKLSLLTIGPWGRGARATVPHFPPKFGQLRFFGQQEKFGQSQFLKKFACVCVRVVFFFFSKRNIFYFNLKSAW